MPPEATPPAQGPADPLANLQIDRSSTAERVADGLRDLIIRGEFRPGAPLREGPIGASLDVSRNTIREAFRLLSREGLVVHQMHRGVVVKELTEQDLHDIYVTRRVLEVVAIEESGHAAPEAIARVARPVADETAAAERGDWKGVATHNMLFHQRIVELIGSRRLDALFQGVLAELRLAFSVAEDQQSFLSPYVEWNQRLATLLERGERQRCADEMARYLSHSEQVVGAVLREQRAAAGSEPGAR